MTLFGRVERDFSVFFRVLEILALFFRHLATVKKNVHCAPPVGREKLGTTGLANEIGPSGIPPRLYRLCTGGIVRSPSTRFELKRRYIRNARVTIKNNDDNSV